MGFSPAKVSPLVPKLEVFIYWCVKYVFIGMRKRRVQRSEVNVRALQSLCTLVFRKDLLLKD